MGPGGHRDHSLVTVSHLVLCFQWLFLARDQTVVTGTPLAAFKEAR